MDGEMRDLIETLEAQRREAMELLRTVTDDQLDTVYTDEDPSEDGPFTIRRLIHRISLHHHDHLQHVLKARRALGIPRGETTRTLAEMQVARTELINNLADLSGEELHLDCSEGQGLGNMEPRRGQEPEYTIRRIVEHVVDMEEIRLRHIRQALEGSRSS